MWYLFFYINLVLRSCPIFLLFLFPHLLHVYFVKLYFCRLSQIRFQYRWGRNKLLPKISSKLSEQPSPETIMGATGPAPSAATGPVGRSSKETAHTPLCHHVCRAGVFCQIVMRHTQSSVQSGQCDISWLMTSKGRLDWTLNMLCP